MDRMGVLSTTLQALGRARWQQKLRHRRPSRACASDRPNCLAVAGLRVEQPHRKHTRDLAGVCDGVDDMKADDPIERMSCRPDFAILIYATINLTDEVTHKGTLANGPQDFALVVTKGATAPLTPPTTRR